MRRTFAALSFTAVLATAAASYTVLPEGISVAASPAASTFLVPANDGYGVGDCLASGGECGRLVADAWCEAQGFVRAVSFTPAGPEDVTGTVQKAAANTQLTTQERPVMITCAK